MSSPDSMTCVACGQKRQYPDGFPNATFAECWRCAWTQHVARQHPKIVKEIRKKARQRLRAKYEQVTDADLIEYAFGDDRLVLAALSQSPAPTP